MLQNCKNSKAQSALPYQGFSSQNSRFWLDSCITNNSVHTNQQNSKHESILENSYASK